MLFERNNVKELVYKDAILAHNNGKQNCNSNNISHRDPNNVKDKLYLLLSGRFLSSPLVKFAVDIFQSKTEIYQVCSWSS